MCGTGKTKQLISTKKKIVQIMCIFMLPLVVVLIMLNIYLWKRMDNEIKAAAEDAVNHFEQTIVTELEMIDNYVIEIQANNAVFKQLRYAQNPTEAYLSIRELKEELKIMQWSQNAGGGYLICDQKNEYTEECYLYYSHYDFADKEMFRKCILEYSQNNNNTSEWLEYESNGKQYLLRFYMQDHICIMAIYDFDILLVKEKGRQDGTVLFLELGNGEVLSTGELTENSFVVRKGVEDLTIVAGCCLPYAETRLLFWGYSIVILGILGIIFVVVQVSFKQLESQYIEPFWELIGTMKSAVNDTEQAELALDTNIKEFQEIIDSFDSMLREIERQRLISYENRLEAQNVKLQFYRAQIKPHFIQNCLTNMYALAACEEYEQLQESILAFSKYLRCVMKNEKEKYTIRDELENVENYVALQQMMSSHQLACTIDVSEKCVEYEIPVLSILTFVENSIKHGSFGKTELKVQVKIAEYIEFEIKKIAVEISDDGSGFSQEEIRRLSSGEERESGKIGIQNVKERFRLQYGSQASFAFFNGQDGGAYVRFDFPVIEDKSEEIRDDSIDC